MDPERWKRIDEIFHAALDRDVASRAVFLKDACKDDDSLREEVEDLLLNHETQSSFFDSPPTDLAAEFLEKQNSYKGSVAQYQIVKKIGSGGMGEVYLAEDTRLNRKVALKILPSVFAQDAERVRRFEREVRAVSRLNHPNIVAIYDTGTNSGSPYLVSELLQGEVLQQKLPGHGLPVRKVIEYGLQIAKGLSAAHEKGIIHRDLKPGNIFITKEGGVKILDFGLAKLVHPDPSVSVSASSENIDLTETGVVLGTIVYMSPEQVTGRTIDHRSDIFAFGSVLYEMLSGKRPFTGDTQIEIMHAILKADPPELPQSSGNIPPSLERIVRRCLEKDPEYRFQSTSDLAFALESMSSTSGTAVVPLRQKKPTRPAWILIGIFFLAATILGVVVFYRSFSQTPRESRSSIQRLSIVLPPNTVLNSSAISPDGQRLAYVINAKTGFSELWLRLMDSPEAEWIPGTEDATLPFWSPDSKSIGFFTEQELKTVTIGGGPPKTLYEGTVNPKGGTWNQYGDILFSRKADEGIYRIPARGGEATPVTTLDDSRGDALHKFPEFLPDGRHFFYLVRGGAEGVYIASLDSEDRKRILPESTPVRFVDPGYLLFVRNNKLMVQQFDKKRFELTGEAISIGDNTSNYNSGPNFSVSENNILVSGDSRGWSTQPIWFDRSGEQSSPFKNYPSALREPGEYSFCDLSSDDKRLLVLSNAVLWMADLSSGSFTRYAMTGETDAVFSPDGSEVAYSAFFGGNDGNLYRRASSGTGKAEHLYEPAGIISDLAWSMDGKFITFTSAASGSKNLDLWALPLAGERKPFRYLQTEALEGSGVLSPDGKWVAYQTYQTGRCEVYVSRFPVESGGLWAISTDGGEQPIWRRDGKELFYLTLDKKLMAVEVQTGEIFKTGSTRFLFQPPIQPRIHTRGIRAGKEYFVSSDGQHFLVNTLIDKTTQTEINVLLNWKSLLKK